MDKKCSKCKNMLSNTQFHKDSARLDGLRGVCKNCACASSRTYKNNNLEKTRAYARDWHHNNPEKSKLSGRATKLKSKYGLTVSQYDSMLTRQKGVCAICTKPEITLDPRTGEVRKLSVDHKHKTGKIRALLCANCNHLIGKAKDSPEICEKAANYLRHYG